MPFLGSIEYHFVSDGISWNDGGGAFGLVPKVVWEKKLPPDEFNRVPLHLNCLLLRAGGKTILVDTGLGDKLTPKQAKIFGVDRPDGGLLDNLARLGVSPAEVDIVINTHLHADHCGGNTTFAAGGERIVPTFPNAEYWIQRLEWADAILPNERTRATYLSENFEPLMQSGHLKLLYGDTPVVEGVRLVITRGHTRAHQSVLLESEGAYGFYVGDLSSLSYHFERTAWVTAYDVEPLETIETKRRWQNWAVETGAVVMFEHDPRITAATLHRDGRHFRLEPLPA
ncbi:MAG: MBL fold metallo-hydrolase [Caldilineae bacterium]|nr:MAG: MBL fold metallo-hydrolase [Caldilineae bacterium]